MRKLLILCLIALFPLEVSSSQYATYVDIPYDEKFQPVDIRLIFDSTCYARDEKHNSIKVFYNGKEIESEIYGLEYMDEQHIKACNIVFLSQGKGRYVIKYGDYEVKHEYKKHVNVIDATYSTKILGYSLKMNYYAIMEEGKCIFCIGQSGNIFGIDMGQKVIKMKEGAKKFDISSWEYVSSFAFFYDENKEVGTDESFIRKEVLVNGNLMVRVKIETTSLNKKVETTSYYTYYYNPAENKRMFVNFSHNVKENCKAKGEKNGILAYLMCIKSRSRSIDELNMGEILPYIHVYGKNGVEEYRMETNPKDTNYKWLLSSKDNVVLGKKPWFCMDDGIAYGLIMDREAEGLKIKAVVRKEIDIPGLSIAGGGVSAGIDKNLIPAGKYTHTCELYFGKNLDDFQHEADNFYRFYDYRKMEGEGAPMKNLSIVAHSFIPARLRVEVWKNDSMVAWKMARFRRAGFILPASTYVVKIFARKKFIGGKIVKLNDDKKVHIFCTFEGRISIKTNDGITAFLIDGNEILSKNTSRNGEIILKAPSMHKYKLILTYNDLKIYEKEVFIPSFPIETYFKFYNFNVYVIDKLGFPCEENLTISLNGMGGTIYGEKMGEKYIFSNIPGGEYDLILLHKNFSFIKKLKIPSPPLTIQYPVVYKVRVNVYDNRGMKTHATVKFERNGREIKGNLPPGKYKVNIYYGKKASFQLNVFSDGEINVAIKRNSWILYAFSIPAIFAISFLLYRRKYIQSLISLFSFSLLLPWWFVGKANLYLLPPVMIRFHGNYGDILSLPSVLKISFIAILSLFLLSIFLGIIKRYIPAFAISLSSISLWLYTIYQFSKVTTGSIYGKGIIEGGYAKWGMGIGFYISIIYAILLAGLMIYEIRRSS